MAKQRHKGMWSRIKGAILGQELPTVGEALSREFVGASISALPESDNPILLDGDRYVDGICCKTVGEYKSAVAKKYG